MDDAEEVVKHAELVVVGSRHESVLNAIGLVGADPQVLDLVRLPADVREPLAATYHAIAW